jgi:hypothetical protein
LAEVGPVSDSVSDVDQGWDARVYQAGFDAAYNEELLTQRRKWSLLAGGVSVLAVSGAWWLGSRALGLGG